MNMNRKFNNARHNLQDLVLSKFNALTKQLDFDFTDSDIAPNTFQDLMVAYKYSTENNKPLPIFSGASDQTIYLDPKGNWHFRFWHDIIHCQNGFQFTLEGEIATASIQLQDVANAFGLNSLEYAVFKADSIGQAYYSTMHGVYPDNQIAFVKQLIA